jgi:hypothetical protein
MSSISTLLTREEERLAALLKKREELDGKIDRAKSNIERYKLTLDSERYSHFSGVLENAGLCFDDVLAAIASGALEGLRGMADSGNPS